MATIAKPPRGLISIFDLNDFGKVPNELAQTIVGTFDISELCLLNRELINGSNSTSPGVGGILFNQSVVPTGELWYVWSAGCRAATAAAETIRIRPCFSQSGFLIPAAPSAECGSAAAEQLGAFWPTGFWMGPGTQLGVIVEAETGAAKNINWYASIVRLRI